MAMWAVTGIWKTGMTSQMLQHQDEAEQGEQERGPAQALGAHASAG